MPVPSLLFIAKLMKQFFLGKSLASWLLLPGVALTCLLPTTLFAPSAVEANTDSGLPQTSESPIAKSAPPQLSVPTEAVVADAVAHHWQNQRLAATLRVQNIPVVTFLRSADALKRSNKGEPLTDADNLLQVAEAMAAQINRLAQNPEFDPAKITATWNASQKQYQILVNEELLLGVDQSVTVPEKTLSPYQTTLQTTNRLRRLLGGATPLTAIANAPSTKTAELLPGSNQAQRVQKGMASWYGPGFHGRRTANGERFNQNALTAAHKHLPFGTKVKVTNLRTGQSVVVRINDRGPFIRGRVIDLSAGAAKKIGVHSSGVAPVALDIIR